MPATVYMALPQGAGGGAVDLCCAMKLKTFIIYDVRPSTLQSNFFTLSHFSLIYHHFF